MNKIKETRKEVEKRKGPVKVLNRVYSGKAFPEGSDESYSV